MDCLHLQNADLEHLRMETSLGFLYRLMDEDDLTTV